MSPDLGNLIGLDDGTGHMTQAPAGPFRLPIVYEEAKERKVAAVAELRTAVKQVCRQIAGRWCASYHEIVPEDLG